MHRPKQASDALGKTTTACLKLLASAEGVLLQPSQLPSAALAEGDKLEEQVADSNLVGKVRSEATLKSQQRGPGPGFHLADDNRTLWQKGAGA